MIAAAIRASRVLQIGLIHRFEKPLPHRFALARSGLHGRVVGVETERLSAFIADGLAKDHHGDAIEELLAFRSSSSASTSIRPSTIPLREWRAGKLRPLCLFDGKPLPVKDKIAGDKSWADIPTCKSQGLAIEYLMLRGIFMPAGVPKEAVDYYVDLLKKVRATPEWAQLMKDGAYNQSFKSGDDYVKWVENEEKRHRDLMKGAGFLATN